MDVTKASRIAVANVLREGLTDIFPRPDEVDLLKNKLFAKQVIDQVERRLNSGGLANLKVSPIQHVLFPKKDPFDFRRAALLQPIDTITYLALVLSVADEIEKRRPPLSANRVFSYRFRPKDGLLFHSKYNFTVFDQYVNARAKSTRTKILVKCDIASFYDRLNLHRLESSLLGMGIDKTPVKLINELLLFWANRDSYGLPTGGNASRILADAALISVDDYLLAHKVNFCRFVDDYRFFAPNIKVAHNWLTMFVERLFLEGLAINPAKTSLEDVSGRKTPFLVHSPKSTEPRPAHGPVRLLVGYTGTIPTKFRELSEKEADELKLLDLDSFITSISSKSIVAPDDFRKLTKMLVAKEAYSKLMVLPDLLDKFPQFTPMVVDLLIKKRESISEHIRQDLLSYFVAKITPIGALPEYISISIVRLLGTDGYYSKDSLMEVFRSLRRNAGAFIGRAIIDALYGIVSRNDVLEIRQYFNRADNWERRAIIRLVNRHLTEDEKRPWLKNVKIHLNDDIFAIETFDPAKKSKKKRM